MEATGYLRINAPTVVHETIDGETILLHLDSGTYYSLTGSGVRILDLVDGGTAVGDLAPRLCAWYSGDVAAIAAAVTQLLAQLQAEGILVPGPAPDADARPEGTGDDHPAEPAARTEFVPPELHKYSDMKELLLLDPIHEVDAAGWPASKPL